MLLSLLVISLLSCSMKCEMLLLFFFFPASMGAYDMLMFVVLTRYPSPYFTPQLAGIKYIFFLHEG